LPCMYGKSRIHFVCAAHGGVVVGER
jgi:hypothetical protein